MDRDCYDSQTHIKLGVILIGSSIASPFWFILSTRNRLFYFWFLLFLGSWGQVIVLQFIVTRSFGEQSPGDANLFAILDNTFPQCNTTASRRFDFHIKCMSPIQSKHLCTFDWYLEYFDLARFPIYKHSFQKNLIQNWDFHFFREIILKNVSCEA